MDPGPARIGPDVIVMYLDCAAGVMGRIRPKLRVWKSYWAGLGAYIDQGGN